MMQDNHIFQGMRRDNHPIRQEKQFLWDAHNIRLTTRDDNTMLSITNEKSTENIVSFEKNETYVGHTVIGDYLVLLTTGLTKDRIYRIKLETRPCIKELLYAGTDLNFNANNPAQMISDYESNLLQKIYWVDGLNPPRVMNIAKPELMYPDKDGKENPDKLSHYDEEIGYTELYKDAPFNFLLDLNLEEKVSIERIPNSNGTFPAGVIQYAFTYSNKYGQESNIFNSSELLYIAHNNRGGSPEDNISTSFRIKIENIQKTFDNINIYSIIRTSIDATPTVKKVTTINIKDIKENTVFFFDTGTTGYTVDPTMLLYVGGKDIIPNCIDSKDNTLFFGNITYTRKDVASIDGLDENIKKLNIEVGTRKVTLPSSKAELQYENQLGTNTSTFKVGEVYRLGLQFQSKVGEWSSPIWIRDEIMEGVRPSIISSNIHLPYFESKLTGDIISSLMKEGYLKVRPVMALTTLRDRNILAQGILCPTVFNFGNRMSNSPFSQASWLLRPFCTSDPTTSNRNESAHLGSIAEFRHLNPLLSGLNRGAEIQNMFLDEDATSNIKDAHNFSLENLDTSDTSCNGLYYVDQSILTFHSPDVEFNDAVQLSIDNSNSLELVLVGAIPFISNYGDIDIQTETPVIDPDSAGYIHKSITNNDGSRCLISGLFFEDTYVDDGKDSKDFFKNGPQRPWMVHLWHRSGSLNNDCVRPDGKGTQSAILKKKIISNLKYASNVEWLSKDSEIHIGTSELQLFNSNEVSLLKIADTNNINGDITYYGNIDSLNSSYSSFRLVTGDSEAIRLINSTGVFSGNILAETLDGQKKVPFSALKVSEITGSLVTSSIKGTITSNTTVNIPMQKEDSETGNIVITNEAVNLHGGIFNININNHKYTGNIIIGSEVYIIEGSTTYTIAYYRKSRKESSFNFNANLITVDPSPDYIGDYQKALKLPKDSVRIKYKSSPHILLATEYGEGNTRTPLPIIEGTSNKPIEFGESEGKLSKLPWSKNGISIYQRKIPISSFEGLNSCPSSYLWLAEIRQKKVENRFGGDTLDALQNNLWIPAGPAVSMTEKIQWIHGDTWFQRFDCLKTYPFTNEDINQVVEIGSFLCETRTNIDGRYDRNRGNMSNLNMSPINFNKLNAVYSQSDTFFNYRILDPDFYINNSYPSQIIWTGAKTYASDIDLWTNLHLANSLDLNGDYGKIIAIKSFNDVLLSFQDRAISQILFNSRVQIQASDGVPIEIANSQKVEGFRTYSNHVGCQDKFSMVDTPMGIYFMDNNNHSLYKFDGQLNNIGLQLGTLYWARENYWDVTWRYPKQNNQYNGIRLSYDPKYQDVYFIPGADYAEREALCYSEHLGQFTSMMSYGGAVMFPHKARFYSIASDPEGIMTLWENFPSHSDSYNTIFGVVRDYGFSFISNDNPTITKIFDTIEMRADCYIPNNNRNDNFGLIGSDLTHINQTGKPFNFIRVDNEYQDTGEVSLNDSSMRKKFRVWRALIPRKKGSKERIRNPWAKITLGMKNPDTKMTILHDLNVGYTV